MTKFLCIRHGESQANLDGIFVGHTDSPLTQLGIKQATLTAEYIATNYTVDQVYASDLQRAFITGKVIADRCNVPIIKESALREINAGSWEGVAFDDLEELYPDSYKLWMTNVGLSRCDEGESMIELQKRVVKTIRRIGDTHPGSVIVIASHASTLRAFQTYCEGKSPEEMKEVTYVSNASVTEIDYDGKDFHIVSVSYDKQLGQLKTTLPKNV